MMKETRETQEGGDVCVWRGEGLKVSSNTM